MGCLGSVNYDPAAAVTKATDTLLALTALDAANLRITFTVPASGQVLVRLSGCVHGATTYPQIMLGILEGATVRGRQIPIGAMQATALATQRLGQEASFVVTGLTPGASLTWDAAYAVQTVVASTGIKYGGPDDTVTDNAFGGFSFSVWDAANLLGACTYDPAVAVAKATSARLAMTAFDTTVGRGRITFTAPGSGNVLWRIRTNEMGAATYPSILLGVLEGATILARKSTVAGILGSNLATTAVVHEASGVITGVSAGSHNWDAAYGVEVLLASTNLHYGGPNDNAGADAWGMFLFELWAA